LAETAVFPAFQ